MYCFHCNNWRVDSADAAGTPSSFNMDEEKRFSDSILYLMAHFAADGSYTATYLGEQKNCFNRILELWSMNIYK